MERLLAWVLLLYPRRMRRRYGPEIHELTLDLIRLEGRSPIPLFVSVAVHGLRCRVTWVARARAATAIAVTASVVCVALVNMGAASAKQPGPQERRSQSVDRRDSNPHRDTEAPGKRLGCHPHAP
jgi:hypothetical protein